MTSETVRVGVFGTSWWADSMYLPPLKAHPLADTVALCGRRVEPARALAEEWAVPQIFTNPDEMLATAELDAVVIATANDSHCELALKAMEQGLHVLCEKPMALNVVQAEQMAEVAGRTGLVTMIPFTYHWMPVNQWVRRLISEGYVGRPLHVNLRYYADFGFEDSYHWRFDREIAGAGIIGDLGSHWIHLARWLLDDQETSVSATTSNFVERALRPDGSDYDRLEDSAVLTLRYSNGAYGVIQVSSVCWEGTPFGQTHHVEVHGDEGTLYATCDWDTVQEVRGVRRNESGGAVVLPIPDDIWGGVRRDTVHNTYRDVFRTTDAMARGWITAISERRAAEPSFAEGLAVQRVIDAAVSSASQNSTAVTITQRP